MSVLRDKNLCPICEKGKLKEIKKNLMFSYKGRSQKFEKQNVLKCDVCGYEVLPKEVNKKIVKDLTDFRRKINGLLLSDQLKSIRENLGINMKQMAELLSVNEKTVGRYENGKITQSEQVNKLYWLFERFPWIASALCSNIGISISGFKEPITVAEKYSYMPDPKRTYNLIANDYFDIEGAENATGC